MKNSKTFDLNKMKNSTKSIAVKKARLLLVGALLSALSLSGATIKSVATGEWEDAATWEGGVGPAFGDDIIIEDGTEVSLSSSFDVNSLTIASGALLVINQSTTGEYGVLNVYGNWTSVGAFVSFGGTVNFKGGTQQTITTSTSIAFYNLTISAGSTVLLAPSTSLEIVGGGVLSVKGVLDLNNQSLTLKSSAPVDKVDATARLGRVTGEIKNAAYFTIERYIPIPFMINGRSYVNDRYMSSPVRDLQADQWRENVIILGGSGVNAFKELEGWKATNSTLKYYDESNTSFGISSGFRPVLDKTTILNPGQGYSLTVGLDGNSLYRADPQRFVVVKSKGEPVIGDFPVPLSKSGADPYGWNLVGNPYPSDIDWNLVWLDNQTTVSSTVSLLDPDGGTVTKGQYYYYNARTNKAVDPRYDLDSNTIGRANGSIIASSQGFFVFARNQGSSVLEFKESHKPATYASVEANFRLGDAIPSVNLGVSNGTDHDNTFVFFHEEARTLGFDADFDAFKSANTVLGISTNSYGSDLAMNGVSSEGEVNVPVTIAAAKQGTYQLTVVVEEGDLLKSKLYLKDSYNNSYTKLKEGIQTFPFEVATTNSSVKRFSIVTEDLVTSTDDLHVASSEMKIYPNPVSGDKLTIQLPSVKGTGHQVEIADLNGVLVYKTTLPTASASYVVQGLSQLLTSGVYSVRVVGDEGVSQQKFVYLK